MITVLKKANIKAKYVVWTTVFLLISAVGGMVMPSLLSQMIDVVNDQNLDGKTSSIITIGIVMAVLSVVIMATMIVSIRISSKMATEIATDLRSALFNHIQTLAAPDMDKFGTASLVTRSTTDITNIQLFVVYVLQIGLLCPMVLIAGIILSSTTGGKLSSVLIIAVPILLIVSLLIVLFIIKLQNKLRKQTDDVNTLFLEGLEGVRVIRAFNKQSHEKARFAKTNEEYSATLRKSTNLTGVLTPAIEIIFGLTNVAVVGLGAYFIKEGEIQVGALVANTQYISMILMSIIAMTLVIIMFPKAYSCAKRIEEIFLTQPSITDGDKALDKRTKRSTVEFKNVTFAYSSNSDEAVLRNFNFSAKPGEFVAIMGRTGSGKSTVLKLIPRMYDTTFGEVLVDGINVKDYKVDELRSIIGYVPQKNVLFSGDIALNLNFGNENGTEEDWAEACRIACADEFVLKKDETYHAPIAQGGTNLSGGQRQRMAIARAVMKKPEIYLFDDSFSALDMKTDRTLRTNLRQSMGDSTVIMVAQRVSSVIDADRIIVIENNEIAGMGTHRELLKTCPLYREIAVLQIGEEAVREYEK